MGAHDPRAGAWHGDFIEKPCRPKVHGFFARVLLSVWFAQEFDVGVETALMELANPGAILGRVEKVLCRLRQAKRHPA